MHSLNVRGNHGSEMVKAQPGSVFANESESEFYWNEPVYPGHYYSFNTHTMRAFALPGMPGLAYASYWPPGQFYYNIS